MNSHPLVPIVPQKKAVFSYFAHVLIFIQTLFNKKISKKN